MAKFFSFPVKPVIERGYVIAYCDYCEEEVTRYFIPEDTDDLTFVCEDCGSECKIIHLSEYEIEQVHKVMEEGMCELCAHYNELDDDIGDQCENCNGIKNWEPKGQN